MSTALTTPTPGTDGPVAKIVPTVWGHLGVPVAADLFETGDGLVNLVAAMPSLHAAYPAMLLLFFWGGVLWGILPSQSGVSWQGHLFGALAGVLAAWVFTRQERRAPQDPVPPVPGLI